jgi:hypothetical protein
MRSRPAGAANSAARQSAKLPAGQRDILAFPAHGSARTGDPQDDPDPASHTTIVYPAVQTGSPRRTASRRSRTNRSRTWVDSGEPGSGRASVRVDGLQLAKEPHRLCLRASELRAVARSVVNGGARLEGLELRPNLVLDQVVRAVVLLFVLPLNRPRHVVGDLQARVALGRPERRLVALAPPG